MDRGIFSLRKDVFFSVKEKIFQSPNDLIFSADRPVAAAAAAKSRHLTVLAAAHLTCPRKILLMWQNTGWVVVSVAS